MQTIDTVNRGIEVSQAIWHFFGSSYAVREDQVLFSVRVCADRLDRVEARLRTLPLRSERHALAALRLSHAAAVWRYATLAWAHALN